jgi:hypothetical protein
MSIETVTEWANRVNAEIHSCYFKFRIGASNDLFDTTQGKIVIRSIPYAVVQWLIVTLPDLVTQPDVMRPSSAEFKWLPVETVTPDAVPSVTYECFREELDAWFNDYVAHVQDRGEILSTNPLSALKKIRDASEQLFKIIDHYLTSRDTIDKKWFPPTAAPVVATSETPDTIVRLFRDEYDEQRERSAERDAKREEKWAKISINAGFDNLEDDLESIRDDLPDFGAPSLDSFEDFNNDEKLAALEKFRELTKDRAARHELPNDWIKGRCGNDTYFMTATETGQTIQYHSPLYEPTAKQLKLAEADPKGDKVLTEIKAAIANVYLMITGDVLVTDNVPLYNLIGAINSTASVEQHPNAEASARKRYDAALTAHVEKEAAKTVMKEVKAAAKAADAAEANRITKIVKEIEDDLANLKSRAADPSVPAMSLEEKGPIIERMKAVVVANNFTDENVNKDYSDTPKTARVWQQVRMMLISYKHEVFMFDLMKNRAEREAKVASSKAKTVEATKETKVREARREILEAKERLNMMVTPGKYEEGPATMITSEEFPKLSTEDDDVKKAMVNKINEIKQINEIRQRMKLSTPSMT